MKRSIINLPLVAFTILLSISASFIFWMVVNDPVMIHNERSMLDDICKARELNKSKESK